MIESDLILLRPPARSDVEFFQLLRNDIELQYQLMARARGSTLEQTGDWLTAQSSSADTIFFVIVDPEESAPVGFIRLSNIDQISQRGELAICLSRDCQGKGFAREALVAIEDYALKKFDITKIFLQVLASNSRAIEFYLKCGYERVGTHVKHFYFNEEFHDVEIMEKCTAQR